MRFPRRSKLKIRRALLADVPDLVEVERRSWEAACDPADMYTEDDFRGHIRTAPDLIYVADLGGKLVGYVSGLRLGFRLDQAADRVSTWYAATGNGTYSTHDPNGQVVFGGSLGVISEAGNNGIGSRLIGQMFVRIAELGLPGGLLGGRLPGMASYLEAHPEATPQEYFELRRPDGKAYDPELRFYEDDFEVRKLLPGYFSDKQSCDYGVLLVWPNPFYRRAPKRVGALLLRLILSYYHLKGE